MNGAKGPGESESIICADVNWRRRNRPRSLRIPVVCEVSSGRSIPGSPVTGPATLAIVRVDPVGRVPGPAYGLSPITPSTGHRTGRVSGCREPLVRVSASGVEAAHPDRTLSFGGRQKNAPSLRGANFGGCASPMGETAHWCQFAWTGVGGHCESAIVVRQERMNSCQRLRVAPCWTRKRFSWFCCCIRKRLCRSIAFRRSDLPAGALRARCFSIISVRR